MDDGSWRQLILMVVLLCFSAFFSISETALTTINKLKLKSMLDEGVAGADKINKLTSNPNKLLSTVLIGNNIANIGASSLATALAINVLGNNSVTLGIATFVLTLCILIFCEITPKTIAALNAERLSMLIVSAVSFFVALFAPVSAVLNVITGALLSLLNVEQSKSAPLITEAELKSIVNVSHEEGVLEIDERRMINNVFEFGDCNAKDVMTPRTDIAAIPYGADYVEIERIFEQERFSRLPVYKESTDNIVGILNIKDFIFAKNGKKSFNIDECMRKPYFTYETKPTSELFAIMRTKCITMAIVLDEYGGTSGLITLEDLIEEIVGDIADEDDEPDELIKRIHENEYILDGAIKITDVNEILGISLESEDYDSIGGFVIGVLGHIPDTGETAEYGSLKFIIEQVDKNRVEKLRIQMQTV